jgi:hypothetical protein
VFISQKTELVNVTLHSKGNIEGVIKLRIFRGEDYPELSAWVQYNYNGPYKGKKEAEETKK